MRKHREKDRHPFGCRSFLHMVTVHWFPANCNIRFLLLGIFQKICLKSFVDCLFHGLFAVVTYKKESPIDPYEILLFLVSMIMFRGDAFLSDPFFLCLLPAGVCTLRAEAKVSPTPIILQTGGITNKVCPFISEKIMRNVKKILSSLLLSVMCYTIS